MVPAVTPTSFCTLLYVPAVVGPPDIRCLGSAAVCRGLTTHSCIAGVTMFLPLPSRSRRLSSAILIRACVLAARTEGTLPCGSVPAAPCEADHVGIVRVACEFFSLPSMIHVVFALEPLGENSDT